MIVEPEHIKAHEASLIEDVIPLYAGFFAGVCWKHGGGMGGDSIISPPPAPSPQQLEFKTSY
jgi:uncharacterized membrane-anchored protein YitT (DUF2179 family)